MIVSGESVNDLCALFSALSGTPSVRDLLSEHRHLLSLSLLADICIRRPGEMVATDTRAFLVSTFASTSRQTELCALLPDPDLGRNAAILLTVVGARTSALRSTLIETIDLDGGLHVGSRAQALKTLFLSDLQVCTDLEELALRGSRAALLSLGYLGEKKEAVLEWLIVNGSELHDETLVAAFSLVGMPHPELASMLDALVNDQAPLRLQSAVYHAKRVLCHSTELILQ